MGFIPRPDVNLLSQLIRARSGRDMADRYSKAISEIGGAFAGAITSRKKNAAETKRAEALAGQKADTEQLAGILKLMGMGEITTGGEKGSEALLPAVEDQLGLPPGTGIKRHRKTGSSSGKVPLTSAMKAELPVFQDIPVGTMMNPNDIIRQRSNASDLKKLAEKEHLPVSLMNVAAKILGSGGLTDRFSRLPWKEQARQITIVTRELYKKGVVDAEGGTKEGGKASKEEMMKALVDAIKE